MHYETMQDFPEIADFHFRVEDPEVILELEKLRLTESKSDSIDFHKGSEKFHNNLKSLC